MVSSFIEDVKFWSVLRGYADAEQMKKENHGSSGLIQVYLEEPLK